MNNNNFFGENGITATSANHICNVAKEYYTTLENELNNINFVEESISLIGSPAKAVSKVANGKEMLKDIDITLSTIADCKSLIAYLREAIKRKEELTKSIPDLQALVDFRNTMPVMEKVITRDDIIASWDIKQLNYYLTLQTKCAVFGSAVHSNALNTARKQAYYAKENPCSYTGVGRDTVIIQKTVTVDILEIDNTFFEIQSQHRKLQAELNGIEASIEDTISKDYTIKSNKYNTEMSDYRTQLAILNQQNNEHLISERDKIKNLKIVIPHNLKDIYSIVNSF